jgi:hypothetical protein
MTTRVPNKSRLTHQPKEKTMFGVLKGSGCIKPEEKQQWMSHVCGLCLTLKDNYGQVARVATNCDAALLAALCQAQSSTPQAKRLNRCPLRRAFKAEVVAPGNPSAQYAASMALLMASTRVQDHLQDDETFFKHIGGIAGRVSRRWARAAQKTAQDLGFDTQVVETQTRRQAAVEARPGQDFFFYARPTELAAGAAFRHTAVIAQHPQNADVLYAMGRAFGRIVYLLDSYQDYAADLALGKFNALAACFKKDEIQEQATRIFRQAFAELKQHLNQLDLPQPTLVRALLLRHLRRRSHNILEMGVPDGTDPLETPSGTRRRGRRRDTRIADTCCDICYCLSWCEPGDCDCDGDGDCDCCGCDGCDCGDCDCGDCDCGDCDCGDCDCGGCDS